MSYRIQRKGRTICKIKANSLTINLLLYLVDTLGYSIKGTYNGIHS